MYVRLYNNCPWLGKGAKVSVSTSKEDGDMFPFVVYFPSSPAVRDNPEVAQKELKKTGERMLLKRRKPLRLACDTIWQTKAWARYTA